MACGCSGGNQTPQTNPWAPPNPNSIPAVYDGETGQLRPLAFGESLPGVDCNPCSKVDSVIPSSKRMQDAYFDIQRRLISLEQKYCECVCPDIPDAGPDTFLASTYVEGNTIYFVLSNGNTLAQALPIPDVPPQEPDSWQSNVATALVTETEG